jgi:hypothetical protein
MERKLVYEAMERNIGVMMRETMLICMETQKMLKDKADTKE